MSELEERLNAVLSNPEEMSRIAAVAQKLMGELPSESAAAPSAPEAAGGGLLGSLIHFDTTGLDFVMTAMFVVIFLNQWEKEKQHYASLIGLAVPLVCLLIFGSGSFILPSMLCMLVLLVGLRKPIEKSEESKTEKENAA